MAFQLSAQIDNVTILWRNLEEQSDDLYEKRLYAEALNGYLKVADDASPAGVSLNLKIARSYYKLRRFNQAERYFRMAIEQDDSHSYASEDLFRYAECLLFDEKVKQAISMYKRYLSMTEGDLVAENRLKGALIYDSLRESIKPTVIESVSGNDRSAFIVPVFKDGVIFYSAKAYREGWLTAEEYLMGDMETFTLYAKNHDFESVAVEIPGGFYNVASPVFLEDDNVIISAAKDGDRGLSLYQGKIKDFNKWTGFTKLPISKSDGSIISASVSENMDTLYFSSNRSGGFGGFDLYYSVRTTKGYTEPVNMGELVNTAGDEMYPLSRNGKFYFTSNGHPGLGGLDNYVVEGGVVFNMAGPMNSSQDDFAICYTDRENGYFSSNRKGGAGRDDLYAFEQTENPEVNLKLQLTRKYDSTIMVDGEINMFAIEREHEVAGLTDENGEFESVVRTKTNYLLTIEKPGFITYKDTLRVDQQDLDINLKLDELFTFQALVFSAEDNGALGNPLVFMDNLDKGTSKELQGNGIGYFEIRLPVRTKASILITKEGYAFSTDTLTFEKPEVARSYSLKKAKPAGTLTLRDLIYELDKYKLRDEYVPALDSLAGVLKKFENLNIIVESHTDSRGGYEYNQQLSQKRSESVRDYLISRGVNGDRIGAAGKGEENLLNRCSDGVSCTDAEHRVNRRTEIRLYNSK
ncbi:OmpA family protein [Marinoscillum sp. MHG1-6]|uniref:OmpA family protein n=1 Tax=Marinoscillum sp. MHG1-6 TaxID=2959627 RepID=UPI0021579C55|nr:OmpA family protein [Marinoscillum sp. MHG1-6]